MSKRDLIREIKEEVGTDDQFSSGSLDMVTMNRILHRLDSDDAVPRAHLYSEASPSRLGYKRHVADAVGFEFSGHKPFTTRELEQIRDAIM